MSGTVKKNQNQQKSSNIKQNKQESVTSKPKTNLFHTDYLTRNIIVILSVIACFFLVQKEIIFLEDDVHWGDESLNMLTVKNIVATGLPVYGTFANNATSPLYNKDALTVSYWEYAVELYLRTPVFLLSKLIDFHWQYYSATIYFYLLLAFIVYYCLKYKEDYLEYKLPFITIAFYLLFFAETKYLTSQFHNIRSYGFTVFVLPLVHFLTNKVYLYSKLNKFGKYLVILVLAFLPGFFHMANLVYFGFWFVFIVVKIIYDSFFGKNASFSMKSLFSEKLKYLISGIILIIALSYLGNFVLSFLKNRLFFSSENIKIIPAFFSFYFGKEFFFYNFILLILLIFSFIKIKGFSKYERTLFLSSIGFLLFCLGGFSIIGGQGIIANPFAYMMFMAPIILVIISLMLTLLFRTLKGLIPEFLMKDLAIFAGIAILFILVNYKKFEFNEDRSDGTRDELVKLLEVSNKYKDIVFVTSKNVHYFYNYMPDKKAYLLRDYADILETNVIKEDFYKSRSGWVKDIGGEILVGKFESFCRMVNENVDKLFYFHRVMPPYLSKELMDELNKVIVGNPATGKYLQTMLCERNDSLRKINVLRTAKESGLFEEEYISLGAYLFNQNLFYECINSCNKALTINPNNTHAMINIGVCYIKLGKWEESIKINEMALSIDPKLETAQKNIQYAKENYKTGITIQKQKI